MGEERGEEAARSAPVIARLLLDWFPSVRSVAAVCGAPRPWLQEFQARGIERLLGLGEEAEETAPRKGQTTVSRVDVERDFAPSDRFDLVLSTDIAEALPDRALARFVDQLARTGDLVVFGAAAPGQSARPGATERWPGFWISQFAHHGYEHFDVLRPVLWYDQRVNWRYAQNLIVYARRSRDDLIDRLRGQADAAPSVVDIVHPSADRRSAPLLSDFFDQELYFDVALVEEAYLGFNILEIAPGKFLAIRQEEGAYYPEKLLAGAYETSFVGETPEAVKLSAAAWAHRSVAERGHYRGFDIHELAGGQFVAVPAGSGPYRFDRLTGGAFDRILFAPSLDSIRKRIRRNTRFRHGWGR